MKPTKLLLLIWLLFLGMSSLGSCASAEKAATERRNLMMPKTTDLSKNSKFNASKKKKPNKSKKQKKRKKNKRRR